MTREYAVVTPRTDTPLQARDVRVAIDGTEIVQGVTCEFHSGLVTGILGPNGAGKTTFLRALAGAIAPMSGSILVNGRPVLGHSRRSLARQVGVIPQHTEFTLELSVHEVVSMGRFSHRPIYASLTPHDHDVITGAIDAMALQPLTDRPAYTLSGGERQRMFLAQLLAQEPSIILLDEPTTHLDIKYQGSILRTIRELVQRHRWTAGIVLHDLNLAYRFCDRLLFLKDGKTVAVGDADAMADPDIVHETFGVEAVVDTSDGHPHVTFNL